MDFSSTVKIFNSQSVFGFEEVNLQYTSPDKKKTQGVADCG